ncbi:RagB/SusD family nutrient uptake outer membrane protein [Pedobacter caeni]|uniref:SusD family protein n=1 Tax=Pedobacter caeni TaxID=288992 RepID=A0A1M5E9X7_9SPHI|nr:RagB/SusD family nutrient uptake outer membrane protein [Pedobacter caeni]SHF76007.1 SusD family protein [Pedobacter caeni]
MKTPTIKIYAILLLLLPTGLYSCKKSFLEVEPKGKLTAKNTTDYNLLLNSPFFNANDIDVQLFLGDELVSTEPYFKNMLTLKSKRAFQYEDVIYEPNEDGSEIRVLMKQLYTYNIVINEVMNAQGGTEEQKLALKAEALTNRAWIYFMLISYYGKPYLEATAATDPGFPIVTASDVTLNKFERASVKEVYDFIINDLQTAIPSLPVSAGNRTRMSKSGAEALLAKVYLFIGKYQEGLVQMDNAFSHLPTAYKVELYDYNLTLAVNGPWGYNPATSPYGFLLGPATVTDNLEVLFPKQLTNNYSFLANDLLLNPQAVGLYGAKDQRLKLLSSNYYGGAQIKATGVRRRIGPVLVQLGMSMPDMYLIRAELKARTSDITAAKTILEAFLKNRMPTADAILNITDQTAMIKFIIEERIREFALQGHRWFDMRRLSVDPIFTGTAYSHQALSETGEIVGTFPLRPERFVLRFPAKILNANPGMPDNP